MNTTQKYTVVAYNVTQPQGLFARLTLHYI